MTAQTEFDRWAAGLRQTHPEMFGAQTRRRSAREKWHPLYQRVYGIQPWEMRRYTLNELNQLADDLEKHGLGL